MDDDKYILTDEALKLSKFHPDHLRELLRQGRIAGKKVGRTWLVDKSSLKQYLRSVKRGRPKDIDKSIDKDKISLVTRDIL